MGRVIAVIPARLGSKSIPEKNFRPLAGYAPVGWVAAAAKGAKSLDAIYVSTDAVERASAALAPALAGLDGHPPLAMLSRDPALAHDDSPDLPVFQLVLAGLGIKGFADLVVHLRPTSPFVRPEDIDACVEFLRRRWASSARSAVPAPCHPQKLYRARPGPSADLYGGTDYTELVPYDPARHAANAPRQGLDPVWMPVGYVDVIRASTIDLGSMEGSGIALWEPPEPDRCVELDEERDWARAEALALERGWRPGQVG